MTADEIRRMRIKKEFAGEREDWMVFFLKEIAAQLAELNAKIVDVNQAATKQEMP